MRKVTYLAVLEPADDGGYGVFYPDLPGCISYGKTIAQAQENAKETLELHIYGMEKGQEELPVPSLEVSAEEVEGGIVTAVSIFPDLVRQEMDSRRVKTNVTIPAWLKELAEANHVNYSRLLENALLEYLAVPGRRIP